MRDRKSETMIFDMPKEDARLDILVENMGRVNYGCAMLNEEKGICGYVRIETVCDDGTLYPWNYGFKTKWTNIALPCCDMSKTDFGIAAQDNRPTVLEGTFKAEPGTDTFFNPEGWEKGFVEINGFNLGRYWSVGPQGTLYVPGELLKEENKNGVVHEEKKQSKTVKNALFDKDDYKAEGFKNITVVVDAGHGGKDEGARTKNRK